MGNAKDKSQLTSSTDLRRHAEERLRTKTAELHLPRTKADLHRLVHELQVHQIELEMQNEELQRTQEALELSRNKYAELYDFAPIGYFSFDTHELIRAVKLAVSQLLGIERRQLANKPFSSYIADADGREVYSRHLDVERFGRCSGGTSAYGSSSSPDAYDSFWSHLFRYILSSLSFKASAS